MALFISDISRYLSQNSASRNSGNSVNFDIILIIILCTFIGLCCFVQIFFCCYKKCKIEPKIKQIKNFLEANKNNNEIFKENCVICLSPLNTAKIQLTTQTDLNNPQQQNEINKNIITLKCGHQYHSQCLSENKINECPICTKLNNPILRYNNERIIWAIQQDLLSRLRDYNPFNPKRRNVTDDHSDGGWSYDAPSYGGGGSIGGISYGGGSVGGASYGSGGAAGSF